MLELGAGMGTVGAVCGRVLSGSGRRVVCTDANDPDHPYVLRFFRRPQPTGKECERWVGGG